MSTRKARAKKPEKVVEVFSWGAHRFDVTAARRAVERGTIEVVRGPAAIDRWAREFLLPANRKVPRFVDPVTRPIFGAYIDLWKAAEIPAEVFDAPDAFLLVELPPRAALPIDGHHRLAAAWFAGRETIQACLIRPDTLKQAKRFYSKPRQVRSLFRERVWIAESQGAEEVEP